MVICRALLALCIAGSCTAYAQAQSNAPEPAAQMGTPEQRAACSSDVGRFCKSVKPDEGPYGYLYCLQAHRAKLRPACLKVIEGG
jgi:hypothetical protein